MIAPCERSAVDDRAAEGGAVATEKLRQGVHDDIGAKLDRPEQDRRRDSVVHDQRDTMIMGDRRERLEVAQIARRIPDAFAEHRASIVVDELCDGGWPVVRREFDGDAESRQEMCEEGVSGTVQLRYGNDVATRLQQIHDGIMQGRLPTADHQGLEAAFERRDPLFEDLVRRVADSAVPVTLDFEVEQSRSVIGAVERIGNGLIDRNSNRPGGGIWLVSAMNSNGLSLHRFSFRA